MPCPPCVSVSSVVMLFKLVVARSAPRVGSAFRHRLRVGERPEFRADAAGDRRGFAAVLEAREIRAIAPRERSAEANTRLHGRVMDDVDGALVVGRALPIPRKVSEI